MNQWADVSWVSLHLCPLYGFDVGREQCQLQSKLIPKNQAYCNRIQCRSPWRFCLICLMQGYKERDSVVADYKKGKCDFHSRYGSDACRSKDNNVVQGGMEIKQNDSSLLNKKQSVEQALPISTPEEIERSFLEKVRGVKTKRKYKKLEKEVLRIETELSELDSIRTLLFKTKDRS